MMRIAIVVGEFHKEHADVMLREAREAAEGHGMEIVDVTWVPGSLEKPLALKRALLRDDIDGAIALGIIEKGETSHGFVMGQAVTSAIIALQIDLMKPIGTGILGPDITHEQMPSRVRPYARAAVDALKVMLGE